MMVRPTQPFIPPGSVNENQLRLGRKRQVWFIILADEHGVWRWNWNPLRTRAIPEHLRGVLTTRRYTNPCLLLCSVDITECEQRSTSETGASAGPRYADRLQRNECIQSHIDSLSAASTQGTVFYFILRTFISVCNQPATQGQLSLPSSLRGQ